MSASIISPHNNRPVSSIGIGSRVTLKGDLGSPVMTAVMPLLQQGQDVIVGWVVGWFNTTYDKTPGTTDDYTVNKTWNQVQFPLDCLELAQERIQ
jgi:hypothetical protein